MNRREVLKNLVGLFGLASFPVQNLFNEKQSKGLISGTNVNPTGFKELDDVLDGGIHLDRKYLLYLNLVAGIQG